MEMAQFIELLGALQSSDNTRRQAAEKMYTQAKTNEPDGLIMGLLQIAHSRDVEESSRTQAAVLLRRLCMLTTPQDFCFGRLQPQNKAQVTEGLLVAFEGEPLPKLQRKIGEVIWALAEYLCDPEEPARGGWPALLPLVLRMANAGVNPSSDSVESAIRLLKDLVSTLKNDIVASSGALSQLLQAAVAHSEIKVKGAALLLVCEIVEVVEKQSWSTLTSTAPVLLSVLQAQAAGLPGSQDQLQESIQAYGEVATVEPDFFKAQMASGLEPAQFFATLAKTRGGTVDSGIRNLALEWLVTYVEKKPKWIPKHLPRMVALVIETVMELMLEVEDGAEELEQWASRMDDEEGDEDQDELFKMGEEAADRIAEALGMECLSAPLFSLIGTFVQREEWQAKHAALSAIRQTVEYVEEKSHIDQMVTLLLQHVNYPHPRVQYIALHAIAQLANDQAPHFQESSHRMVLPVLLAKMDDPVDRVSSMAMSAFVSFAEELDSTLMIDHSETFMTKLVHKLTTSSHRGVREEAITSIAVIAGVIEKDFSRYYDQIMPMLKQFVMHATGEKENRLRGKAFECMSLLGVAVGKEKFHRDAQEAIHAMMSTSMEADDLQREYIKEASERICQCLKRDFAPFLPALLPGIFNKLKFDEDAPGAVGAADDDDEYVNVMTGEGKIVRVHSSKFEEMQQSVQLLHTFCTEMEGAFFDFVPQTAEALLPLLSPSDENLALFAEDARSVVYTTWALLIKCSKTGATERGTPSDVPMRLLKTFLEQVMQSMEKETDPEALGDMARGVSECLKNMGTGALNGAEILGLVQKVFGFMDSSFARSGKGEASRAKRKVNVPAELADDEDAEEGADADEDDCRRSLEDILGALMKIAPEEFMQCLPQCSACMQQWLGGKDKVLALWLACDMLEHLKDKSEAVWPVFMPSIFSSLTDSDPDSRIAASYAVNLAAPLARFHEAAPQAFKILAQEISKPKPKKREEKALAARDNALAAMLNLSKAQIDLCPPEIQAWQLVVGGLPLRDDEEEAVKVHEVVVDLVLADHGGLLGPERRHLGKVLSCLAEIYHVEALCNKSTEEKIQRVFKLIPREALQACAGDFNEKQQKKIEKMLSS